MSTVAEKHSPFHILLQDIGKELRISDVRYMKYLLQGHVNKESLEHLESGYELTDLLRKRRLVSENRLAFLRKLLIEANCLKQVNLLDDFREKFIPVSPVGERQLNERASRLNNQRETLLRMIERVEKEIRVCEETATEFSKHIEECEVQIQAHNQKLCNDEDDIQFLKNKIAVQEAEIESFERKLETVRFFLKKQQVEIDKVKQKLDENKNSASIKKELKEKQDEFEKSKRNEDELIAKHQKALEIIRTRHVEIRHKTQDLICLEENIHDLQMQIRSVKQNIRRNQRTLADLHDKLDSLSLELEETKRLKPLTPFSRSRSQMSSQGNVEYGRLPERMLEYKLLDYGEISERESTVIGRKGKRAHPPQFQCPASVAVDRLGNIYVADYGNARIQVLDAEGNIAREPLNMGGKCRPCALAVSQRGDLVMTDSQIIRVFSKRGELLRPILPVYSKNDRRPELSSVAFDLHGSIYTTDKANHRIQKFSFEGSFLCFIGGVENLHYPMGIVVRKNGDVIVTEFENHRFKIFSQQDLGHSQVIGSMGIGPGKLVCPRGLALDHSGNILVADSQNHRIQIFDPDGESLGAFGRIGSEPGCLDTPYDVVIDGNGNIIVADAKNHRLQVFTRLVPVQAEPARSEEGDSQSSAIKRNTVENEELQLMQDTTESNDVESIEDKIDRPVQEVPSEKTLVHASEEDNSSHLVENTKVTDAETTLSENRAKVIEISRNATKVSESPRHVKDKNDNIIEIQS